MQLDLARGGAAGQLQRGGEAQRLLDGVGDQRGVRQQQVALVGVLGQQLEHGAGQPGRRLDPAQEQHHHQPHDLRGGLDVGVDERCAVDVGLHEVADQVVAGPATTVVEQLDEVVLDAAVAALATGVSRMSSGARSLSSCTQRISWRAALGLGVGQAEHPEEHLVGHRPGQLGGQVDRPGRASRPTRPRTTRCTFRFCSAIRRGRNSGWITRRIWSCRGLSRSGRNPGPLWSLAVSSMSMPSKERYVAGSSTAARTSSKRDSAHQLHFSL